ncbi:hypothetical protein DFH11DRAFT_1022124 [Phellopilus nigrolimitatus]|nr:hypothetical protein DFH11DRAFT_1022124 [Phellopilus nigrolimitatus]
MSSQIVPASFDPFATHPFTNINNIPPQAPAPYPYPRPIPAAHDYTHHPHHHPAAPPLAPSAPSSLPTAQTPVHAPQAARAGPPLLAGLASASPAAGAAARQHVFEPFKLERSSPELQDVLAKKGSPGRRDGKHKAGK